MPKKGKLLHLRTEKARKMTEKREAARGSRDGRGRDASSATPQQPSATPGPSSSHTTPTSTPVESSAKKRKRLFVSDDQGDTVVKKEDYNIIMQKSDLETLVSKMLCAQCHASPECSFDTYGTGTDSQGTISCQCDEKLYTLNSELKCFTHGRSKYYSFTMKLVYNSLLEGLSHRAVQKSCALLDMKPVNKRQWLKYKRAICEVAVKKTKTQLSDSVAQIFKYYADELDRHPDENGVLDIDVSFDGKAHSYLFCFLCFFCILLYFSYVYSTRKVLILKELHSTAEEIVASLSIMFIIYLLCCNLLQTLLCHILDIFMLYTHKYWVLLLVL